MKPNAFPATARLKSKKAVDRLFNPALAKREGLVAKGYVSFPLRAVWITGAPRPDYNTEAKVLFSVPKKKIKKAVDRVKVRRRMKEAWRLAQGRKDIASTDVALLYLAEQVMDYPRINNAVAKILEKIKATGKSC